MCPLLRKHNIEVVPFLGYKVTKGNSLPDYGTTFVLKEVTLNSLSGNTDMQMFGDKVTRMCKTLVDYDTWIGLIQEKSLAYLYGATSDGETHKGEKANYLITAVLPQNKKIAVYFEKLVGK